MATRDYIRHFVNPNEPSNTSIGDEWLDSDNNLLYKRLVLNGTTVTWTNDWGINAASATRLKTAITINGVLFDGTANTIIDPFVDQDLSTNVSRFVPFVDNSSAGYQRLKVDTSLSYNPSTGILSSGGILSTGEIIGTAGTFTSVQNSGLERAANFVSNTWIHATQNLTVASSNISTTTGTGAAVVTGGVGIGGNINVGGTRNLFTGSVGVGTSAVLGANSNVLSVYGTAMVYGNVDLANPAGGTSGIYFNDGSYQTTAFTGAGTPSSGVAGTVQFAGAGSTFSGDAANFFWDDANNRLGLGTQTPQTRLSVGAKVTDDNTYTYDTNSLYVVHQTATSTTVLNDPKEVLLLARQGSGGQAYGAAAAFNISRYENNGVNSRTRLDLTLAHNSFLASPTIALTALSSGAIGIGTTSPTNILTVRSTTTPAWFNTINSAASSNNFEIIVGNGTSTGTTLGYVNNTLVPYGYLSSGAASRNIVIAANGRVGIGGVTAPQVLLDVGGTTVIGASWAGNPNFINPPASGLAVQGSVGIGTYTPLAALDVRGGMGVTAASNFGGGLSVASLTSNGAVSGTTGVFSTSLYSATFNTAGTATVAALVSNGAVSGTTGTFGTSLQSGAATVQSLVSNTNIFGATLNTSGQATLASAVVNANITTSTLNSTGAAVVSSLTSNTTIQAAGTATVNALISNTNITTATVNATSSIVGLNITSNSTVQAAGTIRGQTVTSNTTITAGTGLTVTTGGVNVSGVSQFTGNVNIAGNLNVTGTISTQNANVLVVQDPIIYLGEGNTGNNWDLGLVGNYNDGVYEHTGLVRNHVTGVWTLFDTLPTEPNVNTGNIEWTNSSLTFAAFLVGNVNVAGRTESVSTTTGAIRVTGTGGVGIGGRLNVGGSAWFAGVVNAGGALIAQSINSNTNVVGVNLQSTGQASVASLVSNGAVSGTTGVFSTSLYSATFNTAGTATVAAVTSNGAIIGTTITGTAGTFTSIQNSGQDRATEIVSNTWIHATQNLTVASSNASTTTATGAAVITGGVGIGGRLNVGGSAWFAGVVNAGGALIAQSINSNTNVVGVNLQSTGAATVASLNSNTNVVATNIQSTGQASVASLVSNGAVSGTTGVFSTSLYSATFNTAGTATVAALVSNGAVSGTTGVFSTSLYSATFNTAGTATVAALVSNGAVSGTTITGTAGTFTSSQNSGLERAANIVSNTWIHATQNLTVASSNTSTTTATGAAVITGGVGIGGTLNVGGAAWFASVVNAGGALIAQSINSNTNVVATNIQSTGQASVASLVSNGAVSGTTGVFSTSLYSATFNTAGTATVAALVSNGAISSTTITGTAGTFTSIQNSGLIRTTEIVSNTWIHATQNLTVASSNASTTTATGAAVITGGVGIGGRLNVGSSAWFAGVVNAGGALIAQSINSNTNVVGVNLQSTGQASVASLVSNGAVSGTTGVFSTSLYSATFNTAGTATVAALVSNGAVSGTTGVFSTSLYSAAFNTAGTATVAALVSNGAVTGTTITGTTGTFTSVQNSGLTRSANIVSNTWIHATQNLTVASSNTSISTTTGALVVTGGAGIGGNVNAGGVSHSFNGSIGIRGNTNPWGTGLSSAIQLKSPVSTGGTVSLASIDVDDNLALTRNAYFQDAIDWRHSSLGPATLYQQDATGTHTWAVAPSQNAGNIAAFIPIMTVDATGLVASNVAALGNMIAVGRLGVGTSSDQGFVNVAAFFGTVESYGNVKLITPTGGTAGIYFADGSYQTTAASPGAASSGIAGAVQFSTGTGTFNSDAANLFWDNATDRLGIGTTSPTNVLTVRSTATPAWFNTVNSAIGTNNYEILIGNSVVHGATVGYVNNATVPYGYLSAGITTRNIIIASNGRVGIGGATVPQNILDVNGAAVIGTAYAGARAASANGLLVQGSVGIGTFTPLQPLDVRGNAYIDGTHNLFTGRVGVGTNSAIGASANVLSVYGTAMVFGNIDLGNTAAGGTGVYFSDGTFQNTAYVPTTYTTFTYTGNGSTSTYSTSPVTSTSVNNTMVYINGVYQRKSTYGWSGTTVTFNAAPANFATIEIIVIQGINAPFGSVAGDISVNGNITVSGGAIVAGGSNTYVFNTVATGVYIGGNARDVQIGNAVSTTRFNSANASINTTTGAIVATGGIGIGGNINVGGTRSLFTGSVGVGTSTALGTNANVFSVYGTAMVYGNIDLTNPAGGISGIFFNDGSYQTTASNVEYSIKNSNYTAVNGDKLLCDTSAGTFTVTLPLTPAFGTTIIIYDRANFSTTPLTIGRNSSTIEGLADDFSIDVGQTRTEFVYDGATWHLYVSIGPRGFAGTAAPTSASVAYSVALG